VQRSRLSDRGTEQPQNQPDVVPVIDIKLSGLQGVAAKLSEVDEVVWLTPGAALHLLRLKKNTRPGGKNAQTEKGYNSTLLHILPRLNKKHSLLRGL